MEKAKQAPEGQQPPNLGPNSGGEKASTHEVRTRGQGSQGLLPSDPRSPPSLLPQVPDAGALSRACSLIQQLHVAYSNLASGLQGLPAELQQRVRRARHSLCELYSLMSSASSISELPAERLAQSRGGVGQAWQGLEQLLESVQHSPPLSWLVGPFTLQPGGQQL